MEYYEKEKLQYRDYLSFDDVTIKAFARRIVRQIKEQMKLDNEQCELLLDAIFKVKLEDMIKSKSDFHYGFVVL